MKKSFTTLSLIIFFITGNLLAQIACNDSVYVSLDENGEAHIVADMMLEGGPYTSTYEVSEPLLTCADIGTPVTQMVTDTEDGSSCWGMMTVEDKMNPTPYAFATNTVAFEEVNPGEYQAVLTFEQVDAGSFDNCSFTVDPIEYVYYCADTLVDSATFTLTDPSGNSASIIVGVEFTNVPEMEAELFTPLSLIEIYVPGIESTDLTPAYLEENLNFSFADVNPTWSICTGDVYTVSYEDIVIPIFADQFKMVRTFTIVNWVDNTQTSFIQLIKNVDISPLACRDLTEIYLDVNGEATVTYDMLLVGGPYNSTYEVSMSEFNTSHLGMTVTDTVTDVISGNLCWGQVHINEFGTSALSCNDMVYVSLDDNGEAFITPDMLLEGGPYTSTYDVSVPYLNCDAIDMDFLVVVTDLENGNSCWGTIRIEDKLAPVPVVTANTTVLLGEDCSVTLYFEDFDNGSYDNCGFTASPEMVVLTEDDFAVTELEFTLTDDSGNASDVIVGIDLMLDFNENMIEWPFNLLQFDAPGIDCELLTPTYIAENFNYTFEETYPHWSTCTGDELSVTYEDIVLIVNEDSKKILRTFTILNWNTSTIYETIQIIKNYSNVPFECDSLTESLINWPLDLIELSATGLDPQTLTPEFLETEMGFANNEVNPSWVAECDELTIGVSYTDQVFTFINGEFKIFRTWTIIDWNSSEAFTFLQTIRSILSEGTICDFLPRDADVTDCEFGHTLEDDVEWPSDISVSDHRIKPGELMAFSNIDSLDAMPSFYNEPDIYEFDYDDGFVSIDQEELTLSRQWIVQRMDAPNQIYTYNQEIVINFSEFDSMVVVNTLGNRAVPGVFLTDNVYTDTDGIGFVGPSENINPALLDIPSNGLTIKDMDILRRAVLGIEPIEGFQVIAGDMNKNGAITTIDIVLIERVILGMQILSDKWEFYPAEVSDIGVLNTKEHYVAIKPGDIDDDAILPEGGLLLDPIEVNFSDQLLNAGESYNINLNLSDEQLVRGFQATILYNAENMVVNGATSAYLQNFAWNIVSPGVLKIVGTNNEAQLVQDAMVNLEVFAKQNVLLNDNIEISETIESLVLLDDQELYKVNGEILDQISSNSDDLTIDSRINVFPNPANDFISIAIEGNEESIAFKLYDMKGSLVLESNDANIIDLAVIQPGIYSYVISVDNKVKRDKLIITK